MFRRVSLPRIVAVATIAASCALFGCSSTPQPKGKDSTAATPAVATQTILGNPWHWVTTQTPVESIAPADPSLYTIQFNADGSAVLRADCNRGRGTYTSTADGALKIGPAALTRAMCPPGSLDTKYLQQLNAAAHYFFRGDTLYVDLFADSGTMRFARGPAAE